jgi:predicted DNA-binding transcriptional regulator YafY
MKVERLISILMLLLNRKKLTARELAEYFEVSVRTIQRDMDSLSQAGIPVYGDVGQSGGYQLTDNYKLERSFLTNREMDTLVTMLNGFSDTMFGNSIRSVLEKIGGINRGKGLSAVQIDLTPWGSGNQFRENFDTLGKAIEQCRLVRIEYRDLYHKKTDRIIEPYKCVFKGASWYLFAYCRLRKDYRLFKIFRMANIGLLDKYFEPRQDEVTPENFFKLGDERSIEKIVIHFLPSALGKTPDFLDPADGEEQKDGSYILSTQLPIDEWLITLLLGLSADSEVLEPQSLRNKIKEKLKTANSLYKLQP